MSVNDLCLNGGTCSNIGQTHHCSCQYGFEGSYCEIDTDECASAPCQNGGTCEDKVGHYKCSCALGFQGMNCEVI